MAQDTEQAQIPHTSLLLLVNLVEEALAGDRRDEVVEDKELHLRWSVLKGRGGVTRLLLGVPRLGTHVRK
jgi:hypothetical protein